MSRSKKLQTGAIVLVILLVASMALYRFHVFAPEKRAKRPYPNLILWTSGSPEDLHEIDPEREAVAPLKEVIYLHADHIGEFQEDAPVRVPEGTRIIPMVRIESRVLDGKYLLPAADEQLVTAIARVVRSSRAKKIQLDYQPSESERPFFASMLRHLHGHLPTTPISIRVPASWCLQPSWLDTLAVDEVVPLFFNLGADDSAVKNYVNHGGVVRCPKARGVAGVSLNEPIVLPSSIKHLYVECPIPWTDRTLHDAVLLQEEAE